MQVSQPWIVFVPVGDVGGVKKNSSSVGEEVGDAYLYTGFPKIKHFRKLVKRGGWTVAFCFYGVLMPVGCSG